MDKKNKLIKKCVFILPSLFLVACSGGTSDNKSVSSDNKSVATTSGNNTSNSNIPTTIDRKNNEEVAKALSKFLDLESWKNTAISDKWALASSKTYYGGSSANLAKYELRDEAAKLEVIYHSSAKQVSYGYNKTKNGSTVNFEKSAVMSYYTHTGIKSIGDWDKFEDINLKLGEPLDKKMFSSSGNQTFGWNGHDPIAYFLGKTTINGKKVIVAYQHTYHEKGSNTGISNEVIDIVLFVPLFESLEQLNTTKTKDDPKHEPEKINDDAVVYQLSLPFDHKNDADKNNTHKVDVKSWEGLKAALPYFLQLIDKSGYGTVKSR